MEMKRVEIMEKKLKKLKKNMEKKKRNKRRLSKKKEPSLKRRRALSSSSFSSEKSSDVTSNEKSSTNGNSSGDGAESEDSLPPNSSRHQDILMPSMSAQLPRKRSRKSCFNKSQTKKRILEILNESLCESNDDVTERIKKSLSNDIDESEYFELMKKYKVPLNLSVIKPILIPEYLKLSRKIKNLDDYFVSTQTELSSVISAIISSLSTVKVGPQSIKTWCKETMNKLEDAAVLSIHLQNEIKNIRLINIMTEIKSRSEKKNLFSIFNTEYDSNDDEVIKNEDQKVLKYLEIGCSDNNKLQRLQLSRKLAFLLYYYSHKNTETLSKIKLSDISIIDNGRKFKVPEEQVEFVIEKSINSKLCAIEVLESYLGKTKGLRGDGNHLFLMSRRRKGRHNIAASTKIMTDWINDLRLDSREWNLWN